MLVDEIDKRKQAQKEQAEGDVKIGYAILMSLALAVANFTLVVIARTQYGQPDIWVPSFIQAIKVLPMVGALTYLMHPVESLSAKVTCTIAGIAFGVRAVWLFNNEGYYASMSSVPQLGTVWLWLIIELPTAAGALTLLAVAAYTYCMGFSLW